MQFTKGVLQSTEILKRDRRGRVWVKPGRREALLDEFEKSGMSGSPFARLAGGNYSSFQNWIQRRRKRRAKMVEEPAVLEQGGLRLVEAVVDGGSDSKQRPLLAVPVGGGLLVELPGGARMRVESPLQLRMAAELLTIIAQAGFGGC